MRSASAPAYFCSARVSACRDALEALEVRRRAARACSGSGRAPRRRVRRSAATGSTVRTQVAASRLQRLGAGRQVGAQLARRLELVAGVAAPGVADDQVALEGRGVALERPSRPPTSAPRWARSVTSASRWSSVGEPVDGGVARDRGLEADLVADPLELGAQLLDPGGVRVGAGHQRQRGRAAVRPARRRAGRPPAARRPGDAGGVLVEPAPDQGGDPVALGDADPAAVPGRPHQLPAVGDRLPQRERQHHVGGDLVAALGRERGGVELVELEAARAHPVVERAQVGLERGGLGRGADRAGRDGSGASSGSSP